jgi:glycosyltransferase involved in cell wall biosynthesis
MGTEPVVTVFIPSYNHKPYVGQAIESVLNQSFTDFELIISDDGSDDGSQDVISRYAYDSRVRIKLLPVNTAGGHYYTALDEYNGRYFAILNSDDYWAADKLEKQFAYMEAHPETGAVFAGVNVIDGQGRPSESSVMFTTDNRTSAEWLEYFFDNPNCLCTPSALLRREAINKTGHFCISMTQLPDFDFWIRLLKHSGIHILPEPLIFFRSTRNNLSGATQRNLRRNKNELFLILNRYFDDMPDALFTEAFAKRFRYAEASSPLELECEKTFLYLRADGRHYNLYRIIGMTRMHRLMEDAGARRVLQDKYNYSRKDYWKFMSDYNIDTGFVSPDDGDHGLYQASHAAGIKMWRLVNKLFPYGSKRRKIIRKFFA